MGDCLGIQVAKRLNMLGGVMDNDSEVVLIRGEFVIYACENVWTHILYGLNSETYITKSKLSKIYFYSRKNNQSVENP